MDSRVPAFASQAAEAAGIKGPLIAGLKVQTDKFLLLFLTLLRVCALFSEARSTPLFSADRRLA